MGGPVLAVAVLQARSGDDRVRASLCGRPVSDAGTSEWPGARCGRLFGLASTSEDGGERTDRFRRCRRVDQGSAGPGRAVGGTSGSSRGCRPATCLGRSWPTRRTLVHRFPGREHPCCEVLAAGGEPGLRSGCLDRDAEAGAGRPRCAAGPLDRNRMRPCLVGVSRSHSELSPRLPLRAWRIGAF